MTRADPDYPRRLKERLGPQAPAVFFGCGNRALPSAPAVAVIGSRKAVPEDLAYASALGGYVARAGYAVVSGGARGVDETGMLGALAADGTAVGLLADSLLKAAVAQSWRASLRRGDLALLSPFHPEAGFSPGNAMARNKYVYCLVLAAVVVHSGSSGGTWSGALENLKRGWVPLWVKRAEDPEAGNAGLVAQGGRWLPDLLSEGVVQGLVPVGACPAVLPPESPDATARSSADEAESLRRDVPPSTSVTELATHVAESAVAVPPVAELSPYELFRLKLRQLLGEGERKPREIGTLLGLTGPQLKPWLQQAVDDGLVEKKTKPERYELADSKASAQLGMFDRD
jgi:predicted Rossmann fold nucleotide-binding protein DprA/Smf involved in DNA uptake